MRVHIVACIATIAVSICCSGNLAYAQSALPTEGPAVDGSPAWFIQTPAPRVGGGGRGGPPAGGAAIAAAGPRLPACSHSPVCSPRASSAREVTPLAHVEWKQTMGYTFAYPFILPPGGGGVSGVAIDPKGNLWAFQRTTMPGAPQLFEFGPDHKLIRTVGEDVIGHQVKAHGIATDAQGDVWICDESGATVMEVSPEGKLLKTIGTKNQRGDWDESKGQRLLWEPLAVAFAANGDMYIAEGHANESPNDTDSDDPLNVIGAARIIHLDKNGNFIGQWYGNNSGQGKFSMAHGIAVDPKSGDVWIGDREQYRLVVYTADGKFLRTVQMRNLACTVAFDPHGDLWIASGGDGQILKIDRGGKVLGAIGNGEGPGEGQFNESDYLAWDKQGNLYSGDTTGARVTQMIAPK